MDGIKEGCTNEKMEREVKDGRTVGRMEKG